MPAWFLYAKVLAGITLVFTSLALYLFQHEQFRWFVITLLLINGLVVFVESVVSLKHELS